MLVCNVCKPTKFKVYDFVQIHYKYALAKPDFSSRIYALTPLLVGGKEEYVTRLNKDQSIRERDSSKREFFRFLSKFFHQ